MKIPLIIVLRSMANVKLTGCRSMPHMSRKKTGKGQPTVKKKEAKKRQSGAAPGYAGCPELS